MIYKFYVLNENNIFLPIFPTQQIKLIIGINNSIEIIRILQYSDKMDTPQYLRIYLLHISHISYQKKLNLDNYNKNYYAAFLCLFYSNKKESFSGTTNRIIFPLECTISMLYHLYHAYRSYLQNIHSTKSNCKKELHYMQFDYSTFLLLRVNYV